ncbi:MAG TPA: RNA polymerase subunit sigma-24 [Flavobacteriales bacterium]|jgi:RNA polymerase sigma factor (sigma-70 family)|nr:RNA polymerase subunit sigma-24 [Flavobacteriales bacterium]
MSTKLSSDQELIRSYVSGHETSLEFLIDRYKDRIFGFIISKVQDRQVAEDIFQEVFYKVVVTLKRGRYNEEGKFLPWILRISRNLVIDYFRKRKRMQTVDGGEDFNIFDFIPRDDQSIYDEMVENQIYTDVRSLIDLLPIEQKTVLVMRLYNEMSFKDIAEETGVSINTALGRMRYALINIRKRMGEENLDLKKF